MVEEVEVVATADAVVGVVGVVVVVSNIPGLFFKDL